MKVLSNIWMSLWADHSEIDEQTFYLTIYTSLSVGYVLFVAIRASILYYSAFITSRKIHQNMVSCLLFAPLNEFFDRIPLGRILNRFTKDIDCMDNEIMWAYTFLSLAIMNIINTTIINMYSSTIYSIFLIGGYLFLCSKIQKFYQKA
jgi:ABC-type multidrug transport system fused ATPase/permease subunit